MVEEQRYEVSIVAHEDAPANEYVREVLSELDSVSGIIDVQVERVDNQDRDISEVYRILGDLSGYELDRLESVIDEFTEDGE